MTFTYTDETARHVTGLGMRRDKHDSSDDAISSEGVRHFPYFVMIELKDVRHRADHRILQYSLDGLPAQQVFGVTKYRPLQINRLMRPEDRGVLSAMW
jgi:hypothetical protein